jgi:glycosyltransferase involved in cell wall biosynthesis
MAENRKQRILFITQGNRDHASSRIRAIQYFPLLIKAGYSCCWIPRIPVKSTSFAGKHFLFPLQKRINYFRIFLTVFCWPYEILFIQRMFLPHCLLRVAKYRNKQIIYDFDDALHISEADIKAALKTATMIQNANMVVVSSPVLKEYASQINRNTQVITSPVDLSLIRPGSEHIGIVIGWIGSEWTSKYLLSLSPVFKKLYEKHKVNFLFVGCKRGILPEINPEIVKWAPESEYECLSRMDIGIMPLDNGEFEKGKGGYKLFQYMAAGLPVVASPVGINTEIIDNGRNGYLCDSPEEWYEALKLLIQDENLRKQTGHSGYLDVLEKYSLEKCFEKLREAIKNIPVP